MINILVPDFVSDNTAKYIKTIKDINFYLKFNLPRNDILKIIRGYDGLIVQHNTKIDIKLLREAKKLKVIVRLGTGVDSIDVKEVKKRGIVLMNTPFGNVRSVAELTLGLMLSLARNIFSASLSVKHRGWKPLKYEGDTLSAKTLGVVGFGRIGKEVCKLASAFGMKILVCDRTATDDEFIGFNVERAPLNELLQKSDYVSLHIPLNFATQSLIDAEKFGYMKEDSYLINTSRAKIVDEKALCAALISGKLKGAALDVVDVKNRKLIGLKNIIITPHIGGTTFSAQDKNGIDSVNQIIDFFRDGKIVNEVK